MSAEQRGSVGHPYIHIQVRLFAQFRNKIFSLLRASKFCLFSNISNTRELLRGISSRVIQHQACIQSSFLLQPDDAVSSTAWLYDLRM